MRALEMGSAGLLLNLPSIRMGWFWIIQDSLEELEPGDT